MPEDISMKTITLSTGNVSSMSPTECNKQQGAECLVHPIVVVKNIEHERMDFLYRFSGMRNFNYHK